MIIADVAHLSDDQSQVPEFQSYLLHTSAMCQPTAVYPRLQAGERKAET